MTTLTDTIDIDAMDEEIKEDLKANFTLAIQTELLNDLVDKVQRTISKKAVQDIFRFIYMDVKEDKITVRGINNDYTTEAWVYQNDDQTNFKVTNGNPGSVCFPADKLVPIVKRLRNKNAEITLKSNMAVIKSGRSEFDLNGVDGSEFPNVPELGDSLTSIQINPGLLSRIYDRTGYAASTKETNPVLTGVNHVISEGEMVFSSTDGHRMAQYSIDIESNQTDINITIPVSTLNEVKKHLDQEEEEISVHFYDNQAVFEYGSVILYSRILDYNYPDINRIIFGSEQAGSTFVVQAGKFKTILDNSTVYSKNEPILLFIKTELNQLRAQMEEEGVGSFEEDLSISEGSGEDIAVGVNVQYLQDVFSKYSPEDYVQFEFLPSTEDRAVGMQPFKTMLYRGNGDCLELFTPVLTKKIKYEDEVVIEDFTGVDEMQFNPFESMFQELETV